MLTQKTSGPSVLQTGRVLFLPLGAIRPNPAQPRSVFDAAGLQELAASIRQYIDELCAKTSQKAKLGHFVLRDMRVFFNTINHQLDLIRAAGVDAGTEQRETEHEIVLTIRIPKSACVR